MPYDSYISRGDPPTWPVDRGPSPLIPEDVRQRILKHVREKAEALKMFKRKPKGARRK